MNKDKEIEALFAQAVTEFDDSERFIGELSSRLEKVEYLKRLQEEQRRSLWKRLALAAAAGAAGVAASLALLPLLPTDLQVIRSFIGIGEAVLISGNGKFISTLMVTALSYGITFSIRALREEVKEVKQ